MIHTFVQNINGNDYRPHEVIRSHYFTNHTRLLFCVKFSIPAGLGTLNITFSLCLLQNMLFARLWSRQYDIDRENILKEDEKLKQLVCLAVWREELVWWNWSRYKQIWSSGVWFFPASVVRPHSETLIKTSEAGGNKWCVSGAAVECGGTMKGPSGSLIARLILELQGSLPVLLCQNPLKTSPKNKLLIWKHFLK